MGTLPPILTSLICIVFKHSYNIPQYSIFGNLPHPSNLWLAKPLLFDKLWNMLLHQHLLLSLHVVKLWHKIYAILKS